MSCNKQIDGIYKILPLYEATNDGKDKPAMDSYMGYLRHIYIKASGWGEQEIPALIKGLIKLEDKAEQKEVRQAVLHMIGIIERGGCSGNNI